MKLEVVLTILAIVAAFATAILLGFSRDRRHRATLRRVAQKVGATFVDGSWITKTYLELNFEGRRARLEFYEIGRDSPPCTRVVVDAAGASPGVLYIFQEAFSHSFMKLFGAQDLRIGHLSFDEDYVIRATPSSLAKRIFSRDRQGEGIRVVRRMEGVADATFGLNAGTVTVTVLQCLRREEHLLTLIDCAREFTSFILGSSEPVGIEMGVVRALSGGECPVCGTAMDTGTVRCELCRTPHHSECWQYMGRCSTYACAGKRAVA